MNNPTDRIFTHYSGVITLFAAKTLAILLFAFIVTACTTVYDFTVNTTQDLNDLDPGNGICGTNTDGSVCSLRAAIEEANQLNNNLRVQITVPVGLYELTLPEDLLITHGRMTLSGAGQEDTIVDGLNQGRILKIERVGDNQLLIEKLTLRNGALGGSQSGGAVHIGTTDQPYLVTFGEVAILDSRADFY